MSTEEPTVKKEKKDKKAKTGKKEKKFKSNEPQAEQDAEVWTETKDVDEVMVDEGEIKSEGTKEKAKKRKREALPEELEIDVALPEPPSKKAARKLKKAKTAPATSNVDGDDETENAAVKPVKAEKEAKEFRTHYSIWIGNLPWTATKQDLRDFLFDKASLGPEKITRVHMPPPKEATKDTKGRPAFKNRGFAYVDFDSEETLFSALQLTETPFNDNGRNVLVKNAKSFEGRPEPKEDEVKAEPNTKPPSKRVFIGNLAFEVTKPDLEVHFGQCGPIDNIHMATFEDSGKCKGYAWITFETLGAAEAAVKGYVLKVPEDDDEDEDQVMEGDSGGEDDDKKKAKARRKPKPRKWYVNRLHSREVKREYAEDASTRYKKRYGSLRKREEGDATVGAEGGEAPIQEVNDDGNSRRLQKSVSAHDRRREQRRAQKVDARTIAPGAALSHAPRASAAIAVDAKKGTKVTFD